MLTKLLAKPVVEALQADTHRRVLEVQKRLGRPPKLVVVLVGNDPASEIYTRRKGEAATKLGMLHETVHLPASVAPGEVRTLLQRLSGDPSVDGILVQRPLPKAFVEEELVYWVSAEKDVDAFHPENVGRLNLGLPCFRPCTPAGVMELLKHYRIDPRGKVACIVGRSSIVGKPMATLLLQADATVLHCHRRTADLPGICSQADILVVAAGKPGLINSKHVKNGAVVVDVGIHRTAEGKIVGDVDFESASTRASAMTPVPGGVGPMTIALLLQNTVWSAEQTADRRA